MNKEWLVEQDRVTLRPLAYLLPVGLCLVAAFLLLPVIVSVLSVRGHIGEIEPKSWGSLVLAMPLVLACTPLFAYSRRQVIFDGRSKTVVLKTIGRTRPLMSFAEVNDINVRTTFGQAYWIKSTADRYGKGTVMSPPFTGPDDRARRAFDASVLPVIHRMLREGATALVADDGRAAFSAGLLQFYKRHPSGYWLKPKGIAQVWIAFSLASLCAIVALKAVLTGETTFSWELVGVPFVPMIATAAMLTKRILCDRTARTMTVYRFGLRTGTYPLSEFAGMSVVRKTLNGLYNGTDVRMRFKKPGARAERELTLSEFRKTSPIEAFLRETKLVIRSG